MLGAMLRRLLGGARPSAGASSEPDWLTRALALRAEGRHEDLVALCAQALQRSPDDVEALQLQAAALLACGRTPEGIAGLRRAARLAPGSQSLHAMLGRVLGRTGDVAGAVESLQQAVALPGAPIGLWQTLAEGLRTLGRYDDAERACRDAAGAGATSAALRQILARTLFEQGRVDEAIAEVRAAIALDPDDAAIGSDLLRMLNYVDGQDPAVVWREHRAWATRHAHPLERTASPHANVPDPDRRLRVGFVSPYFRRHAVTFFLESVLEHHDRAAFEVILYADVARPDDFSLRLQGYGCRWRPTLELDDAGLARVVRDDAIDILVDLSGHTPGHRLLAFARRPAPVQVTWNGYPNTTGMDAVGYRLTDAVCDPPGATEAFHSERLVRLPGVFMSWRPPTDAPPVAPLPAAQSGQVTFASFNGCYKVTPATVRLWAGVLDAVPSSRLLLFTIDGEVARRRILDLFAACGVVGHRLECVPRMSHDEFLNAHARADVALDAFPFHGTTTTCFSLWMGVPVVALAGATHASRVGASLLGSVGLGGLVASTEADYVAAAAALASDLPALAALRADMRRRVEGSVLADGPACARAVEDAFRQMWREWCGTRASPEESAADVR